MVDLYVYYKVAGADAARLAPRVRAMQAALASSAGVTGQLKRRPDTPNAPDALQTWMEVYPGVDATFSKRLAAAADAAGLADAIAGARHAEVFIELDSGADANPNANFPVEDAPCA